MLEDMIRQTIQEALSEEMRTLKHDMLLPRKKSSHPHSSSGVLCSAHPCHASSSAITQSSCPPGGAL